MMDAGRVSVGFDFTGKTTVLTGGAGVLGRAIAGGLADCNANLVILDRDFTGAQSAVSALASTNGKHLAVEGDVLDRASVSQALQVILGSYPRVDFLINGAGGNNPRATTSADLAFFDIPADALRFVSDLNLLGTIIPSQVFGKQMVGQKEGVILNISSMNAFRPLTRIPAYSAAKAAVSNFTLWLAVHMAQEHTPNIRVNAIAPGFFLTEQNRFLLTNKETGELTPRGKSILAHTPMNRFGDPGDLIGAVLYLLSPLSSFVTGVVLPIDGGFSAFSGV
jgi:NAD(P)-dependent dehydrogenase (short-subunit alcohol dehydrogenase family)